MSAQVDIDHGDIKTIALDRHRFGEFGDWPDHVSAERTERIRQVISEEYSSSMIKTRQSLRDGSLWCAICSISRYAVLPYCDKGGPAKAFPSASLSSATTCCNS